MAALPDNHNNIDRVGWTDAVDRMDWRPGEHTTLIGPTGRGKTECIIKLIDGQRRKWVVFFATKREDNTLAPLKSMGFVVDRDGDVNPEVANRYIIRPPWPRNMRDSELDDLHTRIFTHALREAFWQKGWTVAIDEGEYINRDLNIVAPVNRLLRQGRSQGNSLILATQRPRHVTLHAYEQATHLLIWRQTDMSNIARAAELAGLNKPLVLSVVKDMEKFDIMYTNTATGDMFITNTRWE